MNPSEIPIAQNLSRDGEESRQRSVPILIYFSQEHCSFCHRLEDEVLRPMVISREYEELVILRELSIDYGEEVINFDGHRVENRQLFDHYQGIVTPMLVITDGAGTPIAEPLVGINTVEYFGWYLDNAIYTGLRQLRNG